MSFAGFAITSSALNTYQNAENIAANDIANVNTPGASMQQATITENIPITTGVDMGNNPSGVVGSGVTVSSIQRLHDNSLDTLYRGAYSSQNYYSVQNTVLTTLQSALAEPAGGVSSAFSNFQTAVSQLASETSGSSSDSTNRQAVLQAAQALTTSLNSASNAVSTQKTSVFAQATSAVQSANTLIDQIAALNGEIRASTAAGNSPNTELDARDNLVDQLSAIVPIHTTVETNGSTLITVGGKSVVNDTTVYHLDKPVISTGSDGTPQLVVGMANDPNPNHPIPVTLGNGSLGGYLDVYNNSLSSYATSLDAFSNSLSNTFNNLNKSGYDQFGQQGGAIFSSGSNTATVNAANIQVALTSTSQISASTASTAAGTLTKAMNASNTALNTSTIFDGNALLSNPPPAGGLQGTLTIAVDGVSTQYSYNTSGADSSIGNFVNNFNDLHTGVSASFDQTAQKIVFTNDPHNESQAFQSTAGYAPTASFTITDSNNPSGVQAAAGVSAPSLLEALGAGEISGVQQNSSNALGSNGNTNSISMQNLFAQNVGVPPVTNYAASAITPGTQTVPLTGALGNLTVGQTLTIGPGTANQENVLVTGIDSSSTPPTFTATFLNSHAADTPIVAAQQATLGEYYANLMTKVGFDGQTANTGQTTQTNLTTTLQTQRTNSDGINLDQETQALIQYQTAYSAAAKTFSVLQAMLTAVMSSIQ